MGTALFVKVYVVVERAGSALYGLYWAVGGLAMAVDGPLRAQVAGLFPALARQALREGAAQRVGDGFTVTVHRNKPLGFRVTPWPKGAPLPGAKDSCPYDAPDNDDGFNPKDEDL